MHKILIIALQYLEPEWSKTLKCIQKTGLPFIIADRDGVGNMSRAFNDAFFNEDKSEFDFVWFVTNITFKPDVPAKLAEHMGEYVAIHPAFNSDAPFLQPNKAKDVIEIPFLEFNSPMFRTKTFEKFGLDPNVWYYYFDLIISKQLRDNNLKMACDRSQRVDHVYLRNANSKPEISIIREKLRAWRTPTDKLYMEKNFGKHWRDTIWKNFQ